MQERKNKRRFIILVILTVSTLVAFWWTQPENMLDIDDDTFRADDLTRISKVELTSASATISLEYKGSRWRVNDKYDADADLIRVLFATLQQAIPKRVVAAAQKDSIYNHLVEKGIKVSLYEGEIVQKQFYAGGNIPKTQAFFADPVEKRVYVMAIPGYRVYVSGIFEVEEIGWRDKYVFGFNWRNFKSLEVEFAENLGENFKVTMGQQYFGIEGMAEVDTARLNTFLDDVSLLTVDEYVSEPRLRDSLESLRPGLKILVTDIANRTYHLRLYNIPRAAKIPGVIQEDILARFDRRKVERLWRPKSFFRKK